jgi:hypothetical protein
VGLLRSNPHRSQSRSWRAAAPKLAIQKFTFAATRRIHHLLASRVQAYELLLCLLAYYVKWYMRHARAAAVPPTNNYRNRIHRWPSRRAPIQPRPRSPHSLTVEELPFSQRRELLR